MPKRNQKPTLQQILSGGAEPGDELDARQRPGATEGKRSAQPDSNDTLRTHHAEHDSDRNPNSANGGAGKP